MGVVFLAQHQRIVRRVAIKVLAPDLVRDHQAVARFFLEARATSLIRHPGIVDIIDCDVNATGRAYIVLEHLEGETVAERLRRAKRLHWSAACLIARRVADALGAAHDKGIVHRDLKPENIFLVGNGRDPAAAVKVLDFGVAKLLASEAVARLTMRGTLVGTPEYMSPEQCAGTDVDHRADIYSLGCILFEMVTGEPPFVTSTVGQLVLAHRFQPAPSAAVSCPDLPDWLDLLLQQMTAKDPESRPQSMQEVSKALCRYKAQRWTHVTAGRRSTEQGERREAAPAQDGTRPAIVQWFRRRRAEAMVVVAAMAVLAGAAWAIRRNEVVRPSPGGGTNASSRVAAAGAPAAQEAAESSRQTVRAAIQPLPNAVPTGGTGTSPKPPTPIGHGPAIKTEGVDL